MTSLVYPCSLGLRRDLEEAGRVGWSDARWVANDGGDLRGVVGR